MLFLGRMIRLVTTGVFFSFFSFSFFFLFFPFPNTRIAYLFRVTLFDESFTCLRWDIGRTLPITWYNKSGGHLGQEHSFETRKCCQDDTSSQPDDSHPRAVARVVPIVADSVEIWGRGGHLRGMRALRARQGKDFPFPVPQTTQSLGECLPRNPLC